MAAQDNQALDRMLLTRIKRGDEEAKEALVRKYLPMVHRIVRGRFGYGCEYDDLVHEGAIGLLKAILEYDPLQYAVKFSTFAYLCVARRVCNSLKQACTKKRQALRSAISLQARQAWGEENRTIADAVEAKTADPLETIMADWSEDRLRAVLRVHLSVVEFTVIDLLLQGLNTAEIQDQLCLEPKVVDNARTRARLKLRRLVREYGSLLNPDLPLRTKKRLDLAMRVVRDESKRMGCGVF